jgi:hypothetical protein
VLYPRVSPSRSWAALLVASLLACAQAPRADVVILVDSAQTQRPEYLTFTWLTCNEVLVRDRRVPEQGSLPESATPIASIYVELSEPAPTERTVVVTGMAGGKAVSQGTARVRIEPGVQARIEVRLSPGLAADDDRDGIPDQLRCLPADAGIDMEADTGALAADAGAPAADAGAPADVRPAVPDAAPDIPPVVVVDSPLNMGLAGLWHFDETAGGTARDSSGGGNDANVFGGPGWKPGRIGGALDLGVPGIRATVRDAMGRLDVGTDDFSLSVWINTRQVPRPGQWPDVFIKVADPDTEQARGYELVFSPEGQLICQLWAGSTTPFDVAAMGLADGQWHHVVCREAAGVLSLYADGHHLMSRRHQRARVESGVPLRLGGSRANPAGDFNGLIDELRIYRRALTDPEIAALADGAAP